MILDWLFCIKYQRCLSTCDARMEGTFEWNEEQPI